MGNRTGVGWHYLDPYQVRQNAFVESFKEQGPRRMPERGGIHDLGGSPGRRWPAAARLHHVPPHSAHCDLAPETVRLNQAAGPLRDVYGCATRPLPPGPGISNESCGLHYDRGTRGEQVDVVSGACF